MIGQVNWEANQEIYKPDEFRDGGYRWDVTAPASPQNQRVKVGFLVSPPRIVTDPHEVMAFIERPRSMAVGAEGRTEGPIHGRVNLNTSPYGFEISAPTTAANITGIFNCRTSTPS